MRAHRESPPEFTSSAPLPRAGAFTWDPARSVIVGPASYMATGRFDARLEQIKAGRDQVFNFGLDQHGNVVTALLVSIQTDYAAWLGQQETLSWLDRAVRS